MNAGDRRLADWARRAADDLREFAAAGREAGNPMHSTEALVAEIDAILSGRPVWQWDLARRGDTSAPGLDDLDTPEAPTCIQPQ
jgi:hypothetical protein